MEKRLLRHEMLPRVLPSPEQVKQMVAELLWWIRHPGELGSAESVFLSADRRRNMSRDMVAKVEAARSAEIS
jgi:hypothetical protein